MEEESSSRRESKVELISKPEEELSIWKVFSNSLLQEKIFTYAMYGLDDNSCPLLNTSSVRKMRAIGKDWNDWVLNQLYKLELPFLEVSNYSSSVTDAALLTSISKTFGQSSAILGFTPPIHLDLSPDFMREENHKPFRDFLISCGTGITRVHLAIPMSGGTMRGPLEQISLPSLETFIFEFAVSSFNDRIRPASENVTLLIQSILNGAPALKILEIWMGHPRLKIFQGIHLPPTLTEIALPEKVSGEDLEKLLVDCHLPNLTSLNFSIAQFPVRDGLVSRILAKHGKRLKKLIFYNYVDEDDTDPIIIFRFPVMEKLEYMHVSSISCHLAMEVDPDETHFPKLRVLELRTEVIPFANHFMTGFGFRSVVHLELVTDIEFKVDTVFLTRLHKAFTSLRKFYFLFWNASGLDYIFQEMTKLVELKLIWAYLENSPLSNLWDGLLIGVPVNCLEEVRRAPRDLDVVPDNLIGYSSIVNLKNLCSLSVHVYDFPDIDRKIITDLSFRFAFFKMPLLKKLDIVSGFEVSPEIIQRWEEQGRVVTFSNHSV